jgi:pimeloyl-ACP methyl ester carboxylesterase
MAMSAPTEPERLAMPLDGGELAVLRWPGAHADAPLAVLLHDITANALAWGHVGPALAGDFEVFAPDLRGRAGSAGLPGTYGLEAHAEDVAALVHGFGDGRRTVLAGHSMGGFVATMACAGVARDRVHGLVLVDGGVELPQPAGADLDAMLAATVGPALDRLSMTFPDLDAVRAFWAADPAVGPWVDDPVVAAHLARDLVPVDGGLRSACVVDAIRVDGADMLANERVLEATSDLPIPATLLWASRGPQNQAPGLYDELRLARLGLELTGITAREVPDTDHYSILWAGQGVAAIAEAVRAALV